MSACGTSRETGSAVQRSEGYAPCHPDGTSRKTGKRSEGYAPCHPDSTSRKTGSIAYLSS